MSMSWNTTARSWPSCVRKVHWIFLGARTNVGSFQCHKQPLGYIFFLSGLPRYVPLASTFDKQRTKSCGRGGATEQDVSMFKMSCFPTRPPILTIVCRCLPVSCWSTSTLLANIGASRINISNISQYLTRIKWSQQSCLARIS